MVLGAVRRGGVGGWLVAAVLVLAVPLVAGPPSPPAAPPPGVATPCDRSRRVHTEPWGVISDGPAEANYTQNSHCEWLIKAKNASQFINLKFQLLRTECSYDYVFVYDGDSFNAPLLGSFSGKTQPQTIIASSGFMLILLYSDTNYVLDGFRAEYSISDCPGNCSGHGDCIGHKCVCQALNEWGGRDCSQRLCPDNCNARYGHGRCSLGQCICNQGYSGRSCSLHKAHSPGNRWHWLYEGGMSPRSAHSAIYSSETDSLYIFGGYDLNHVLGDLVVFRFNTSSWEDENGTPMAGVSKSSGLLDSQALSKVIALAKAENVKEQYGLRQKTFLNNVFFSLPLNNSVNLQFPSAPNRHSRIFKRSSDHDKDTTPAKPAARYSHAACNYKGGFLMYGGKLADGSLSDELWQYEVSTRRWSVRGSTSQLRPPPLARHTLTLANDGWVYLVGGSNQYGEFSSAIFSIRLFSEGGDEEWREVKPRGGKPLDVRIVAHSTVYSRASHSLIIYGGILANVARFSTLSDRMLSFSLQNRHWAELHYPRAELRDSYVPQERAFHTATVMGNYMIIFGGYSHKHNREEICYDNQLYLYHLGCHTWVNHEILGPLEQASQYPKEQGVFAHASAVRNGNTLLIVGGYHGNVNADLLAFTLPPSVASQDGQPFEPEHFCSRHQSLSGCTANPKCGWCSVDAHCYGRTLGINCTTNLQTTRCPGVCPALTDCHSCLLHAPTPLRTHTPPSAASVAHKLHLGQCTWCVQNARCHHKDDNFGVCGLREDTPSQIAGWWGDKGTEVMNADTCRLLDRRPGLTFIIYKSPMNWTQPDYVSIVNATTADFGAMLGRGLSRMEQAIGGELTGRLLGFLRPPPVWDGTHQQLRICVAHASAVLRLAHNGTSSPLEIVGNLTAAQTQCVPAQSSTGVVTTLLSGRYLIDFEAKKSPLTNQNAYQGHHNSKIELLHNRSTENPKMFTFEYLEPYESNGSCDVYKNCLHCLSDSLCGWCELNGRCFSRDSDERLVCRADSANNQSQVTLADEGEDDDGWQYLNLVPSHCANCSNYVACESCVGSGLCEWWPDEAKCSRKWRSKLAVKELEECPAPCYRRSNCSQCLDGSGRCVWCESTQECFTFAVYTSQYQFGMCREWLDQGYQSVHSSVPRSESRAVCDVCGRHTNCSACLRTLGCGWCYDLDNPIQGVCTPGDFSRSYVANSCSAAINSKYNTKFDSSEVSWSYAQCPDVDECGLGLHDCHKEAKCTNTHGSYSCQCRRGFIGDGKHSCTETCYNKCMNGYCSGSPHYTCKCDQGWTGEDCSTNCGCHNHSTCSRGVGLCDECHEWTTGDYCQFCKAGSYGNATSVEGCKGCNCNDHGNASLGVCDTISGQCFCQDNTEGPACSRCKKDYYGDPRRGGTCYYQCMARGILTSSEKQGLGSRLADTTVWESRQGRPSSLTSHSLSRECLWIVSPHKLHNKSDTSNIIQLTIDKDIQVPCLENSVYIYDGLPDFVSLTGSHQSHVLGVFCSQDTQYPITVEAKSGILTVHYKQGGHISEGFNATVSVLSCPKNCPHNRECRHGACVCPEGTVGTNCSDVLCPANCSAHLKQGYCDKGYGRCLCTDGWGGPQCDVRLTSTQIVFSELFNSEHLADNLDHLRKMLPRFGHSLLADRRGSLWLFGGYSLSHGPLNDIRLFDTKNNTWMQITIDSTSDVSMPEGRYFHAAEIVHSRREIFVYGGLAQKNESIFGLANNTLSDFWKFSLKNSHWVNIKTLVSPPPLAGHTMTLRREGTGSESLVLIGGFSPRYGFLDVVWEFSLEAENWTALVTTGHKPLGICGHSTVYHAPSKSFYVFGGMVYGDNHTYISDKLYALHYPSRTWTRLPAFDIFNHPIMQLHRGRFLHTAVTTDDYMLVFGGRVTSIGSQHSLIAYSYNCNQWVPLSSKVKAHLGVIDAVGSLPPATYAHAMTMDLTDEQTYVYIMGGFTGGIQSRMTRITLPPDLCSLWSGKSFCRLYFGCLSCTVSTPEGNVSHCYSSWRGVDPCASGQESSAKGAAEVGVAAGGGQGCNSHGFSQRTCEQYRTCTDCLARWPTHWNESQGCKWCWNCGGGHGGVGGHCVPESASSCDKDGRACYDSKAVTTDVAKCPGNECSASDCDKCLEHDNCVWTRQVATPSGVGHNHNGGEVSLSSSAALSKMETHDWGCHPQDALGRLIGKSRTSGGACPPRCSQLVECDACLTSQGAEGGWHECGWSTRLNECISPSYQPLYCAGGVCGLVLAGGHSERCPQACSSYKQCSSCLKHAHCGWCSLDGMNFTGEGVCTEGSLERPASGPKKSTCDKLYSEETRMEVLPREANFSWHYVQCPPENECLNNHHNCDELSEQCVDLEDGYRCDCGKGYRSNGADCVPVCSQGCVRGSCISPDLCRCDFGYVGANCSIQCQCNGHSECAGPDRLDTCLQCHNNTLGSQCQRCKPLFVGSPLDNGVCVPCSEYCYGHTNICINSSITDFPFTQFSPVSEIESFLQEGPTAHARCVWCGNKTTGERCEDCIDGNFRGQYDQTMSCRPCECHGHGDTCDPVTGEQCNCGNNTESDASCQSGSKSINTHCWSLQCSKCRESYMGTPTEGHQCYKQMTVDFKFCLDAKLIDECKAKQKPLSPGQTVFFVVQPKFMNVDIRVTVDVTLGGLDLFLSPRDDTFIVEVNSSTGTHSVHIDPRYKKSEDAGESEFENATMSLWHAGQGFPVDEREAKGPTTFVTVGQRNSLLFVRNLTDRLVLTLPQDKHDLSSTRFYVALTAVGRGPAYGTVFFRQDQLHIDLFVFFSVFFSCFFLFLAACVVAWKAKQAADVRRARRRHVVEMLHMAKRPFASVTLILDDSRASPSRMNRRTRNRNAPPGDVRPVAIEPTDDGVAAVSTVFIKLPGGREAPVKLALASTLMLLARVYPANNRAFLRRRSSHS